MKPTPQPMTDFPTHLFYRIAIESMTGRRSWKAANSSLRLPARLSLAAARQLVLHGAPGHLAESPVANMPLGQAHRVVRFFGAELAPARDTAGVERAGLDRRTHGTAGFRLVPAVG